MMPPSSNLHPDDGLRQRAFAQPQTDYTRHTQAVKNQPATLHLAAPARKPEDAASISADISQRFGARLRTMRCARDLTQQSMAHRFGIDRSFISDMERGRKSVSLVTLEILAIGLGVTLSELLADV